MSGIATPLTEGDRVKFLRNPEGCEPRLSPGTTGTIVRDWPLLQVVTDERDTEHPYGRTILLNSNEARAVLERIGFDSGIMEV